MSRDKFNKRQSRKRPKKVHHIRKGQKNKNTMSSIWKNVINGLRSDVNDAGVSVSSKTIRRRLADVRLRGRIPRKKPYLNLQQR
ncbi:hypothetical protein TNCV_3754211 [Trichonephila clavipes]|nr:hypothetical protein TNCV_3754211 [Trichonephila clavipes]